MGCTIAPSGRGRARRRPAPSFIDEITHWRPPGHQVQIDVEFVRRAADAGGRAQSGGPARESSPRTPRLNGEVERSHRLDAEEYHRLLDGVVIDDTNIFYAELDE